MKIRIRLFHVKRDFYSKHKIVPNRRRWAGCYAARRTQYALNCMERPQQMNGMTDFLKSIGVEVRPESVRKMETVH